MANVQGLSCIWIAEVSHGRPVREEIASTDRLAVAGLEHLSEVVHALLRKPNACSFAVGDASDRIERLQLAQGVLSRFRRSLGETEEAQVSAAGVMGHGYPRATQFVPFEYGANHIQDVLGWTVLHP